jgi:hypothetical protein
MPVATGLVSGIPAAEGKGGAVTCLYVCKACSQASVKLLVNELAPFDKQRRCTPDICELPRNASVIPPTTSPDGSERSAVRSFGIADDDMAGVESTQKAAVALARHLILERDHFTCTLIKNCY